MYWDLKGRLNPEMNLRHVHGVRLDNRIEQVLLFLRKLETRFSLTVTL